MPNTKNNIIDFKPEFNAETVLANTARFGASDMYTMSFDDFIKFADPDFPDLVPVYIQRGIDDRLGKLQPKFSDCENRTRHGVAIMAKTAIIIVEKDFYDPNTDTLMEKDSMVMVDSNTRCEWFFRRDTAEKLTQQTIVRDKYSEGFCCEVWKVKSDTELDMIYDSYNYAPSAESKAEKIQGLNRSWQVLEKLKQHDFVNGRFVSALENASKNPLPIREKKLSLSGQYKKNFDALMLLDSIIPKNSSSNGITDPIISKLKSQQIMATCLLMLQERGDNAQLRKMIETLCTITLGDLDKAILRQDKTLNPIEIVALEYSDLTPRLRKTAKTGWLNGLAGSPAGNAIRPQMDFLTYWFSKYIAEPEYTICNDSLQPDESWSKGDGHWRSMYKKSNS